MEVRNPRSVGQKLESSVSLPSHPFISRPNHGESPAGGGLEITDLQVKRKLRKKRQQAHQSEVINMRQENDPNNETLMTKNVIENITNPYESCMSPNMQHNYEPKPSQNTSEKCGGYQNQSLPSFSCYIEEADAFAKHLTDLAQHTARYNTRKYRGTHGLRLKE